ncbi:recombinase family protein [Planktothrix paucivesiculata]|uniref:Recombinase n=1 Tax=Planktothrix paucivesiculata PCC 9631 TaxID=671071 RepID=A0A7Z9BY46_9CYAN|nr:recombinase family protein [Planktothrix paucivesiculata]VXD23546.1 Recombinase [Planktothrix paucivesiculata PCC 9631]
MKIIAYCYTDPLFEQPPDRMIWGWEVDRVYQDLGERQELEQLLKDCDLEPPDYLLIRRLEELGNSVLEVSDRLQKLESFQINIIAIESDFNTSVGAINRYDLIQLFLEIQTRQRSRRILTGHAKNRIKALPPPGKAPYGYRRGKDRYILDRSVSPIVKEFFDRFLIYGSLRGAVRYLEKRYGKKISVTTGRRWLTNPVYRGDLEYKNGEIISNTHIPIISRDEAAQVDRLLRRNQRLPPRTASAPRSLAGLVICGECQSLMTVSRVTTYRKDREYLYLRPINCPKNPKCKALSYQRGLELTIERICQDLPQAVSGLNLPDLQIVKHGIIQEINQKQEILLQITDLLTSGILDLETAELRRYKLRIEISQLQGKLAELPPVNLKETAQAVCISQFWLDLSETERRFYFREFIKTIEIIRDGDNWELKVVFIF